MRKIAIVGAGICGLYLGWKLSEKGFEVTIFEKKNEIGKETCSGLFSQRILEFIPQSKKLIENEIEYVKINFPSKTLKIKFSKKFFLMSHYRLDNLVASLAETAGAKIFLNNNIFTPPDFPLVIGCDGSFSQTRKNLGLPDPEFYLGIQGFLAGKERSNFVETWPTKNGFLWKIPRSRETEYGIIEKPELAKNIFENFLKEKKIILERQRSAALPQGLIIPDNKKVTLCGDAAGLTKPWSGGGVVWGLVAANILLRNFPDFLKYKIEVEKYFLRQISFSKMVKKLVYFFGFNLPWLLPANFKIEGDFLL